MAFIFSKAERRCDGLAVFVKEENKRLGGPFEVDIFNNMTLEECQTMCVRAEKYVFQRICLRLRPPLPLLKTKTILKKS